jgi:hypothetical protein
VDVSNVTDAYPLLGAAMEAAADDLASPELEAAPQPEPMPQMPAAELAPIHIPAPPPAPEPVYIAPPVPPAPEPEPTYTPPPTFVTPPAPAPASTQPLFAQVLSRPPAPPVAAAPPPVPNPAPVPAPVAAPSAPAYSLLEALGRQSDLGPSMSASASMPAPAGYGQAPSGPAPGGTFGSLLAGSGGAPGGYGAPGGAWGGSSSVALRSASLLPAAAVTVPLSEVLRLVAVGAPAPSSPFDAFRAAVRAPGSR